MLTEREPVKLRCGCRCYGGMVRWWCLGHSRRWLKGYLQRGQRILREWEKQEKAGT